MGLCGMMETELVIRDWRVETRKEDNKD